MLITHWKTEGHKKNVLKKDKSELMINTMYISNLLIILSYSKYIFGKQFKLSTFKSQLVKSSYDW